jgi:FhaA, N-terminal domain/FHA domain
VAIRGFERRLERMVEGVFARAFKSTIRPVELARRLAREMDDHVSVGVRGTPVAANHYTVYLSPSDYQEFAEVLDALRRELCDAARAHARDEGYGFMGPVEVEMVMEDSFGTGWFEVEGRFREGAGGAGAGSLVLPTGDRFTLAEHVITIGRRPESNIVLADPNVSRGHAEIRPQGDGFLLVDLGSTNGSKVNGVRVDQHMLRDGDEIQFGNTRMRFEAS